MQRPNMRFGANACRLCWTVFVLAVLSACGAAAAAEPKRILILHSFGQDFRPWSEYAKSIRSELQRQSPWQLDITDHSLVTARSTREQPEIPFVEYLRALFSSEPPDLIVSVGAPAASFIQRHRSQLFPATPMVLTAVDERRIQFSFLSENDTAVPVRIDYLAAVENIVQVLPDTRHVMVVVGTSPIEQFWKEEISNSVKPLTDRISFTWTNDLSFGELLKRAAALPPHSAIFWELMIVDAAGVVHEGNAALAKLHAVSNAPIFSYDESFFGREIVGGPLLAVLDTSQQTAALAIRILRGEKAGDIKVPSVTFSKPKFDWREMQRWGISETRLPPGSEIHFRESTAWERYRWQLTGISAALLLQMSMIMWLLVERHRRQRAEQQSRTRLSELIHLNRSAAAGAMSAAFAHELSQPLGAIALNVDTALQLFDGSRQESNRLKDALADIRQANQHALNIMKHVRGLLKRSAADEPCVVDLNEVVVDSCRILCSEANKRDVALSTNYAAEALTVLANPVRLQQAILNLALNGMDAMADTKAGDRVLTIQTALIGGEQAEVVVSDTGKGIPNGHLDQVFDAFFTTKPEGTGLGLPITRHIVVTYGGKIWAEHRDKGGTTFRLRLPLVRSAKWPPSDGAPDVSS